MFWGSDFKEDDFGLMLLQVSNIYICRGTIEDVMYSSSVSANEIVIKSKGNIGLVSCGSSRSFKLTPSLESIIGILLFQLEGKMNKLVFLVE